MEKKKKSPAFQRTDQAIVRALINLLNEKTFEKITVQDILDAAPVSRNTFYLHFQDKYQLAKYMLDLFLEKQKNVLEQLSQADLSEYSAIIRKMSAGHYDLCVALMQIHTEEVDLRQILEQQMEQHYLAQNNGPCRKEEAYVYAQTMTALQMLYFYRAKTEPLSASFHDQILVPVFLNIFHLKDDEEVMALLQKKLKLMDPTL